MLIQKAANVVFIGNEMHFWVRDLMSACFNWRLLQETSLRRISQRK